MALPALATLEDFELRLGRELDAPDAARAQADLIDASSLVRSEAGQTWVDEAELLTEVPDVVVAITVAVARRRFENPRGFVSENAGPFAYRLAGGDDHAGLFLTAGERRALRRFRTGTAGFASVPLSSVHYEPGDPTILPTP